MDDLDGYHSFNAQQIFGCCNSIVNFVAGGTLSELMYSCHDERATMKRAGILGPMACPKGLRHGFGISAAGQNVPINLIQRWMGHASAVTTAIYLDAVGVEERRFASRMW